MVPEKDDEDEDEDDDTTFKIETLNDELLKLTSTSNKNENFNEKELVGMLRELEKENKLMFRGGVIHLI
tara:strand:+ start:245 stop:451 length:207 start_codon:yes stop_codon:yes gene_type:complete